MTQDEWREVLTAMRKRKMTAKQIAKELGVGLTTLKKHWSLLPPELRKRLVANRRKRQLVLAAIEADGTRSSYEIAEALGVDPRTVQRARQSLPGYEKRGSKRQQALEMLRAGDRRPTAKMAAEIGCSVDTVQRARHLWIDEGIEAEIDDDRPRCKKCSFLPEPENPFDDNGVCLYCRLFFGANVNLFTWHRDGRPAVEGVTV